MTGNGNFTLTESAAHPQPGMTHWDHVAETTTWGRYITDIEKRAVLRAESLAGPPGAALDIGCGGGRWTKLLVDRGWNVTATEVNQQALAICRRNVPAARSLLAQADDRTLPLATGAARLVLCIEVIPVIESAWFPAESHRVLAAGGVLAGVYFNSRSWRAIAWRLKQRLLLGRRGNEFYRETYSSWRERMRRTGFELIHEESFCWGPFRRDSNSPLVPACARVERTLGLHHVVSWSPWVVFLARKKPAN